MDKILTVNDVAAILQVKAITVREMFRESRLRGFKVGKAWRTTRQMLQEDIEALVRGDAPVTVKPEVPAPVNGSSKPARKARAKKAQEPAPVEESAPVPDQNNGNGNQHAHVEEEAAEADTQQLLF